MRAARWSNHNCESWPDLDLELDEQTLSFQAEVRDFLSANAEAIPTKSYDNAEGFAQHRHWDKVLFDAGLSVITWPKQYGGRDAPLLHWVVFEEEYFTFDLKAKGVTVRPIVQLGGDTGFGEIFLDDVFVPDGDVIGTPNDGWRAAMSTSSNERGMSLRSPARFLAAAERLVRLWKDSGSPPEFAERVADGWIKAQAYRLQTFGTVTRLARGGELGAESSV